MKPLLHIVAACLLFAVSCVAHPIDPDNDFNDLEHVTYDISAGTFTSPERGFYYVEEFHSDGSYAPVSVASIQAQRRKGYTLLMLEYFMPDFLESDISDAFLHLVRENFEAVREGGAKAIVRFSYCQSQHEQKYKWDASEERVLAHIAQLKPLLQEYFDVIYVLQAGFVGVWGEWYYTSHFIMNPVSDADYLPRKHVLDALLDALPAERQVEVRTPVFKKRIYGFSLADTLTRANAHNGTIQARVGGHNDCFVASDDDYGTYVAGDDRAFWKADTRYTIMGGETCALSNYCHCEGSGDIPGALSELQTFHYSYLNIDYNGDVLNRWRSEGCFDEVNRRLGYRLELLEAWFSPKPAAGSKLRVVLRLRNSGFAAPMNRRKAYLKLRTKDGVEIAERQIGGDMRFWGPDDGDIFIDTTIGIPADASGEVGVYLWMPDDDRELRADPLYSIRLANEGTWDAKIGANLLKTMTL